MGEQVLLLNSGGLDTLYVARKLAGEGYRLRSVFVFLGHSGDARSAEAARKVATAYAVDHREVRVEGLVEVVNRAGNLFTRIPYQTQVLFTLAASLCASLGIRTVASGAYRGMMGETPAKMRELLAENFLTKWPVEFVLPALDFTPAEQWAAVRDDPLVRETYSCNNAVRCCDQSDDVDAWCPKCQIRRAHGID